MKKLLVLIALLVSTTAYSQVWFQASMEHKFNAVAGLSVSNELGYNYVVATKLTDLIVSPSVDYTYFSDGTLTQTLLFKCVTFTLPVNSGLSEVFPYVSVTASHLNTYPVKDGSFGYSAQVGTGFNLSKNSQFFFQYRYFKYTTLLEGQLTQFGIMYTFGE